MALQKQLIPLSIDKGLDTKLDPKQEESGYLRKAENIVYETLRMLRKRNGYDLVDLYDISDTQLVGPVSAANYKDELLVLTRKKLYSYSETRLRFIEKGPLYSNSATTKAIIKTSGAQSQPDAMTIGGFNIYVWKDAITGVRYSVQDNATESLLISNALVEAGAERPVLASVDARVFIIYGVGANLKFKSFSILEPETLSSATTVASNRHTTLGLIDAESAADRVVVAYNASAGGDDLQIFTIASNSAISSIVGVTSESASHALDIFIDSASRIVVTFSDNTQVRYLIYPLSLSASILSPTNIETVAGVTTCCSVETGTGTYRAYYEVSQTGLSNNYIKQASLTSGGTVTGIAVFKRSVGLGARAFSYNDDIFVVGVHDSEIQSSYFIFDANGYIVNKLANQTAAGVIDYGVLQPVLATSDTEFLLPMVVHNRVQSDNGNFYSTDGISAATLNFDPDFKYSNAMAADGLHICAGLLKYYDGATVTEHGFQVFPETLTRVSPTTITLATTTQGVSEVVEAQFLRYSAVAASGSFTLTIGAETTAAINWNDSNATIKATIEALTAITTVTVIGNFTDGHLITFDAPVQNFSQAVVGSNTLATVAPAPVTITVTTPIEGVAGVSEVQTISFSDTPIVGQFTIDIDGETTAPVNYTQGATELKAAIEGLASITTVTVTGSFAAGFTVTFTNPVAPIEQATVIQNSLSSSAATGNMSDGNYGYVAVYKWTDNNGRDHRSAPTLIPLEVILQGGSATQQVTVSVPTLRITDKTNAVIEIYRTENNGTTYYRVTSDTSPLLNDTTVDTLTFSDTLSDATLISREILYTTGGVLENIAAPASFQVVSYNGDRLAVVGENSKRVYFSKQTAEGRPMEFTDGIYRDFDQTAGNITTLKVMNDKLLVFTNDACSYMNGDGPNNLGLQDTFNKPEIVTTDIGCIEPRSAVLTPTGIMFQSRKGIWEVSQGLAMSYKGDRVEQFNSATVTSAQVIGELNQVRFTLSEDRALVYNYHLDRWSTFENHGAIDAIVIGNDYYYLREDGVLYKENRTSFSDAGSSIKLRLETGWLSPMVPSGSGMTTVLQGLQRIRRALILGDFKSAHKLRIRVAYDFNEAWVQEKIITVSDFVNTSVYGEDATYGDSSPYGGPGSPYQMRVDFERQKCQSIKLLIEDVQEATGEGLSISGISIHVGVKKGDAKLPATNQVGTS